MVQESAEPPTSQSEHTSTTFALGVHSSLAIDLEDLNFEFEAAVWGDVPRREAARTVPLLWRNEELANL